jgi:hypothetical protein
VASPALDPAQQAELKAAVQEPPSVAGVAAANWNWKGVRQFVQNRFGVALSSRTCLNYLHRLGFVLKRPKKRLLKANAEKRAAFVAAYAELHEQAHVQGVVHGRSALSGRRGVAGEVGVARRPALVDTSSPRRGEKATYYSAVCVQTGEVEAMALRPTNLHLQ